MGILSFIENMAAKGRYHFSTDEAAETMGVSHVAARAAISRLRKKGMVAAPSRGFNVIVPPEYRRLGCLPPEQFIPQLMERLDIDYYVGLLRAAEMHGAAHQRPQVCQVVVAVNRSDIRCGEVRVRFVRRRNVSSMPVEQHKTPRGYVKISSPETTAFDLVGYPGHCGGLGNVATVLSELSEKIRPTELVRIAPLSPLSWTQRLGYLLETVGDSKSLDQLAEHVRRKVKDYALLNPGVGDKDLDRSTRWKLTINEKLETDR